MDRDVSLEIGTIIQITYFRGDVCHKNLFLIHECFIEGASCVVTQIYGENIGWAGLISNMCSVEKTNCCHPTLIPELFELEIKQLLQASALQSVQYFSRRLDSQTIMKLLPLNQKVVNGYGLGTVFVVTDYYDGFKEREAWILANSSDSNYWFNIVQISGRHAGFSAGYVRKYDHFKKLTMEELWREISYNFSAPEQNSLVVYPEGLVPLTSQDLKHLITSFR